MKDDWGRSEGRPQSFLMVACQEGFPRGLHAGGTASQDFGGIGNLCYQAIRSPATIKSVFLIPT
jgi:hypothetical protein